MKAESSSKLAGNLMYALHIDGRLRQEVLQVIGSGCESQGEVSSLVCIIGLQAVSPTSKWTELIERESYVRGGSIFAR